MTREVRNRISAARDFVDDVLERRRGEPPRPEAMASACAIRSLSCAVPLDVARMTGPTKLEKLSEGLVHHLLPQTPGGEEPCRITIH